MRQARLTALAALGLAAVACGGEPLRPDVLLVTVERLPWEESSVGGGPVATPALAKLAAEGVVFEQVVSAGPGGAPAALSLLSGRSPAEHGWRRLDGAAGARRVPTLGDVFAAAGFRTGAFSQVALFPEPRGVAEGFEAWMSPVDPLPLGLPGAGLREELSATVAHAQHWLLDLEGAAPALAWVHFDPAFDGGELDRAAALADLDRGIDLLFRLVEDRAQRRGVPPVVVVASLSGGPSDPGRAREEAWLLSEESVRTRCLVRDPALPVGRRVEALVGLAELHGLIARLARPGASPRLEALVRGQAPLREAVVAESFLPMTLLGARPELRAVRARGVESPDPDPVAIEARAGDPGWPEGHSGPSARELLPEWRRLDGARRLLAAGRADEAARELRALVDGAGPRASGARLLLGLAESAAGRAESADRVFAELGSSVPPSHPTRRQAALAGAAAARAAGRPAAARDRLARLAEDSPSDVDVLFQLGIAAEEAGDPAGAVAALGRALSASPGDPRVLAAVARVHRTRGRPDLASQALGEALKRRPSDGPLLYEAADAALAAGDYWSALDRLDRHGRIFGARAETRRRIGTVYRAGGRWASAITFFAEALELDAEDHASRVALGEALLRAGNEEDGRAILTVARARRPASPLSCRVLVGWLLESEAGPELERELGRCLAAHPDDPVLARLAAGPAGS